MFQKIRFALLAFNLALLFANCVKEIDFSSPSADQDDLVITGRLTNLEEPQILRLTRPGNYDKQRFEPVRGATVTLSDDQGHSWQYLEFDRPDTLHFYHLPDGVHGEVGRAYTLDVQLANGKRYSTTAQVLPVPVPLDSVTVKGEMLDVIRTNGQVVQEPYLAVTAHTHTPSDGRGGYVRWDCYAVQLFFEIEKIYDPISPNQRTCFLTFYFNQQNAVQRNLSDLQPGAPLSLSIGSRRVDQYVQWRSCFNGYQLTTSKEAFDYWKKVEQLLSQNGTIFDTPPAPIPGNLLRDGDPNQPALGFFEVCGADVRRVFYYNGNAGPEYVSAPAYCGYDWSRWPPVNHPECDDCRTLKNSTQTPPWYW